MLADRIESDYAARVGQRLIHEEYDLFNATGYALTALQQRIIADRVIMVGRLNAGEGLPAAIDRVLKDSQILPLRHKLIAYGLSRSWLAIGVFVGEGFSEDVKTAACCYEDRTHFYRRGIPVLVDTATREVTFNRYEGRSPWNWLQREIFPGVVRTIDNALKIDS